jgi:hypothetical protein
MAEPGVPESEEGDGLSLPCGERIDPVRDLDMGMREYECACGATHAVVMDVHPPSRFLPEEIVAVLRGSVEVEDEFEEFGTPHLLGAVTEEFPEEVASTDVSEDPTVGYAMVWVCAFGSRELHEYVVELVVELMEHAVGHSERAGAAADFEDQMHDFDVAEFVEQYRARRDFEEEGDAPA